MVHGVNCGVHPQASWQTRPPAQLQSWSWCMGWSCPREQQGCEKQDRAMLCWQNALLAECFGCPVFTWPRSFPQRLLLAKKLIAFCQVLIIRVVTLKVHHQISERHGSEKTAPFLAVRVLFLGFNLALLIGSGTGLNLGLVTIRKEGP